MYNIKVFYFLIKLSVPLQGVGVEGNDDDRLKHFLPYPVNSNGGVLYIIPLESVNSVSFQYGRRIVLGPTIILGPPSPCLGLFLLSILPTPDEK